MPKLENVPNFEVWKYNHSLKNPNELQRKQISEFTEAALYGNYNAVYLTEIERGMENNLLSHEFVTEIIPSCRYGNQ